MAFLKSACFLGLLVSSAWAQTQKQLIYAQRGNSTDVIRFLERIAYDTAVRTAYGTDYKVETLYTLEKPPSTEALNERQALALGFFHSGTSLDFSSKNKLFPPYDRGAKKALDWLKTNKLVVSTRDHGLHSVYSLYSLRLSNDETLYVYVDLPPAYRGGKNESTAQLATTSLLTLWKLENDYVEGQRLEGVAADFGSGTGLLGMALLKLHPGLKTMYGLEIDPHSMHLAKINAQLNGLSSRYMAMDNTDPSALHKRLSGKKVKLDYAVANPPFNIVPTSLSEFITDFGDGGCTGLKITSLFIRQFAQNAKPGAKFFFYSQLARDANDDLLLEDVLDEVRALPNVVLWHETWPLALSGFAFDDMSSYVDRLLTFASTHSSNPSARLPEPSLLETELEACHVETIWPYFVEITSNPRKTPTGRLLTRYLSPPPFMQNYGGFSAESPGGVQRSLVRPGGVHMRVVPGGGESIRVIKKPGKN